MTDIELLQRFRSEVPGPSANAVADGGERLDAVVARATASTGEAVVPLPEARRARRVGASRFAVRLAIAALVVALLAGGAVFLVDREVDQRLAAIPTVALPKGTLTPGPAIGHGPVTVLVVGSDSRSFVTNGVDADAFGAADAVPSDRADVVVLVRIDRNGAHAVWIPRDLAFTAPGASEPTKISSALAGGPGSMVEFVSANLGVKINHYVSLDMSGFAALVDELGGVDVSFPAPIHDEFTGLDAAAGCTRLTGADALALVRSRHAETLIDGPQLTGGGAAPDLSRIANQQVVLDAIRTRAEQQVGHDPAAALKLADRLVQHATVDRSFSRSDLRAAASILLRSSAETSMTTLPVEPTPTAPVASYALVPGVSITDLLHGESAAATSTPPLDSAVVVPC